MFDKFLKVAHEVPKAPYQEAFAKAPEQTLFDILSGEPKLAFTLGQALTAPTVGALVGAPIGYAVGDKDHPIASALQGAGFGAAAGSLALPAHAMFATRDPRTAASILSHPVVGGPGLLGLGLAGGATLAKNRGESVGTAEADVGKLAYMCGTDDHKWIEQFAGTPLQDQATALEQQDIQNEIAEKQYNMGNDGRQRSFWQNRDQLQLQKRMLELQLFQSKTNPVAAAAMAGVPAAVGPEADVMTVGAGGGSPATPETGVMETGAKVAGVTKQAIGENLLQRGVAAMRAGGPAAERAAERMKLVAQTAKMPHVARTAEELHTASKLGPELAQFSKAAAVEEKFMCADQLGRVMAKQAFGMEQLRGLGTTALDTVRKNPSAAAALGTGAVGGVYGAATAKGQNGQGPTIGQRLGRAAGFGAMGAGVGAAATKGVQLGTDIHRTMGSQGISLRDAAAHVAGKNIANAGEAIGMGADRLHRVADRTAGHVMGFGDRLQNAPFVTQ
jgi:hypothetical protein